MEKFKKGIYSVFLFFISVVFIMSEDIEKKPKKISEEVSVTTINKEEETEKKASKEVIKETVEIVTNDGWILKGDFYKVDYDEDGKLKGKTILLLHMLPSDRSSFNQIISELTESGFNILNLDWRGHGESIYKEEKCSKGGFPTTPACPPKKTYHYKEFSQQDYKDAIKDVEAAIKFLQDSGAKHEDIGIIGASIGANFAVRYAHKNQNLLFLVLLSPGLKYMDGVEILDLFKELAKTNIKIFLYSSSTEEDSASYESCQKLAQEYIKVKGAKKENLYTYYKEWAGHGTNMLRFIRQNIVDNLKQFAVTKESKK